MILEIGIGIIAFGTGLFVGSLVEKLKVKAMNGDSAFSTWVQERQKASDQKKAEKAYMAQLKQSARMEAMQQMQPELVAHMKEQERKKLTGEDKKEKLAKFANAFSMSGMNTDDKLNRMLGTGQQPVAQPVAPQPVYQQPVAPQPAQRPVKRPVGRPRKRPVQQPVAPQPVQQPVQQQFDPFSSDKIGMMLGGQKTSKQVAKDKDAESKRIMDFLK